MTGPKSNLLQMAFNYAYNILLSVVFALTSGKYTDQKFGDGFVAVELVLNVLCLLFSLSCTFVDPGIVTLKTHLVDCDEDLEMPDLPVQDGSEFYMYSNKEAILLHLQIGEAAKSVSLQNMRQLREKL